MNNLVGQKFGKLTVKERAENDKHGNLRWLCSCDCGNEKIVHGGSLFSGLTKSCGCFQRERAKFSNMTHGYANSKTYHAWQDMLNRCSNINNKDYKDYGGRGITVCERWSRTNPDGFKNFLDDIGEIPKGKELDRIKNNKLKDGYSPENCKLSTREEQNQNKRSNIIIPFNGKNQLLVKLAEEYNVPYYILYNRIYVLNWSIEKSLITTIKKYKRKNNV